VRNTHCNNIDERRLPGELQPHQRQFHLLFPEDALEPLEDPVDEGQHPGAGVIGWVVVEIAKKVSFSKERKLLA